MKLYIAEKPSLGRAIAEVLPKPHRKADGCIYVGNGDCVSWCVGHLLEQAEPDAYDARFKQWRLGEIFELFTALEYLMERECENLSGGEMQMVAISRALLGSPGLVLLDEPTQGLAPKVAQDVMATVCRLKEEGIAVLLVEHNARSALAVSDRVYIMDLGRIVHAGSAPDLLADITLRKKLLGI